VERVPVTLGKTLRGLRDLREQRRIQRAGQTGTTDRQGHPTHLLLVTWR
jgi:hypothetical protein